MYIEIELCTDNILLLNQKSGPVGYQNLGCGYEVSSIARGPFHLVEEKRMGCCYPSMVQRYLRKQK